MTARRWIDGRVDVYLDELAGFGLLLPREAAAADITARLEAVAVAMRIGEQAARRYVTDDAVRETAREAALVLAAEQPGADLFVLPRDVLVPAEVAGRTVAGLAEAALARLGLAQAEDAQQAVQLVSVWGQMLSAGPDVPRALVARTVRLLRVTAEVVTEDRGELAGAMARNAAALERLA